MVVTDVSSERAKPIRYGRMVIQIFLNRRKDGSLNPKLRIRREVGRDGNTLVEGFFLEDINDVMRCLVRGKAWLDLINSGSVACEIILVVHHAEGNPSAH